MKKGQVIKLDAEDFKNLVSGKMIIKKDLQIETHIFLADIGFMQMVESLNKAMKGGNI